MTNHRYPTLLVVALAATFIGAAFAQTKSDETSRMPANKGMAQESQTQPSTDQTDKMKGQKQETNKNAAAPEQYSKHEAAAKTKHEAKTGKNASEQPAHMAHASHKAMKHGAKSKRTSEEAAAPDEKAYREALRDCVKQQNEGQRDSCIDSAIEKFHRNA